MDIKCAGLRYSVCLCVYSLNVSHGGGARRWDLYAFTSGHPVVGTGQEDRSLGTTKELMSARRSSGNISGGAATFEMYQQP